MDGQRKADNELWRLAPRSGDGHMYPIVSTATAARSCRLGDARCNERLIEIKQIKGRLETHPALSPADEFASYEILSYLLGDPQVCFDHIVGTTRARLSRMAYHAGHQGS
jgi:hypothetical protein